MQAAHQIITKCVTEYQLSSTTKEQYPAYQTKIISCFNLPASSSLGQILSRQFGTIVETGSSLQVEMK